MIDKLMLIMEMSSEVLAGMSSGQILPADNFVIETRGRRLDTETSGTTSTRLCVETWWGLKWEYLVAMRGSVEKFLNIA